MQVELLMTVGCHLCDDAEQLVRRALPQADILFVDIGDNDADIERYGQRIPVVRYADTELDWPFSLLDIRTLAAGKD